MTEGPGVQWSPIHAAEPAGNRALERDEHALVAEASEGDGLLQSAMEIEQ